MTETNPPRHAYVLGVDPGTTTGLAVVVFDMESRGKPQAVWSDQLPWHEACTEVEQRLAHLGALVAENKAVMAAAAPEKFTITARTAQRGQEPAEDTMGMLGVVRRNCAIWGVELGPLETASAAKNLIQDHVLKGLNLFQPGLGHCNDAFRHALLFAVKRKWMAGKWLVASASR